MHASCATSLTVRTFVPFIFYCSRDDVGEILSTAWMVSHALPQFKLFLFSPRPRVLYSRSSPVDQMTSIGHFSMTQTPQKKRLCSSIFECKLFAQKRCDCSQTKSARKVAVGHMSFI